MFLLREILHHSNILTAANMKARYRKTLAGFAWVILNPLIMYCIQVYVFKNVLKVTMENYPLFLLGGLLPWAFISTSIDMAAPVFVNSSTILKSLKIHPVVLVSSQVSDNAVSYLTAFLVVLLSVFFGGIKTHLSLLLLPIPLSLLLLGTFSFSWSLAIINVFYRDTRFIVGMLLNVLFYLTPIFYSENSVPLEARKLVGLNPIYTLIKPVRLAIHQYEFETFSKACLQSLLVVFIALSLAIILWKKLRNELYFRL